MDKAKKNKEELVEREIKNGEENASEEKILHAIGKGEMDVMFFAEGEVKSLETDNYEVIDLDGKCIITYDLKAVIKVKNSVELDVKEPVCESIEEDIEEDIEEGI